MYVYFMEFVYFWNDFFKMGIKPTYDNIFVEPLTEKDGQVFVPPMFRRRHKETMKGITVKCGPDAIVSEGEEILFNTWQDNMIEFEGKKMLIIKPHHIIAIQ